MATTGKTVKIVVIAGIRPQYVKLAALQRSINRYNEYSKTKIVARYVDAGQHYDENLRGNIINELGIHFDDFIAHTDLGIINILGNMIIRIYQLLDQMETKPNWVIVFGDGNPTLAGTIAASRKAIPIVHIEAGMKRDPLEVEEANRIVADHLSKVNFCVSKKAVQNLRLEGRDENSYWTGDLAYEFIMECVQNIPSGILGLSSDYILASIHRPINLDDNTLCNIIKSLEIINRKVVFVLHPRTRRKIEELGLIKSNRILFSEPLSYLQMLSAIKGSKFLLTDSGGLIREAYHLGKRCLVRRDIGGWSELIDIGFHKRIGRSKEDIFEALEWAENISDEENRQKNMLVRRDGIRFALNKLVELSSD